MKRLASTASTLSAWSNRLLAMALCAVLGLQLGGCASRPPPPPVTTLLHDDWFAPPAEAADAAAVFALSPEMQRYADTQLAPSSRQHDRRLALVEALFKRDGLRLEYDAASTRTARQAFDARAGNCLALVLMTAAFANHLGLPVSFRSVQVEDMYTRSGSLLLANGHVNLVFGAARPYNALTGGGGDELVVDFLPARELRGQRFQPLAERTVVAMYFNNRAAEALAAGHVDDAYAWARAAMLHDTRFMAALNTLAVVYLRSGHLPAAEDALRHVLAQEPDSTSAWTNLVSLLDRAGRSTEAEAAAKRLAQLQPAAPFQFFDEGRLAMTSGDYRAALQLFERELQRQPYQPEVHFWAAQAYWGLGDSAHAAHHLSMAIHNSASPGMHDLYAAKLNHLQALKALQAQ